MSTINEGRAKRNAKQPSDAEQPQREIQLTEADWERVSNMLVNWKERTLGDFRGPWARAKLLEQLGKLLASDQTRSPFSRDTLSDQLDYWLKLGIVKPAKSQGKNYGYDLQAIERVYLAAILTFRANGQLSPRFVAGAVAAWFVRPQAPPREFKVNLTEIERAHSILVGRALGTAAGLAIEPDPLPREAVLACRRVPQGSPPPPNNALSLRVAEYSAKEIQGFLNTDEMLIGYTVAHEEPEVLVRLRDLGNVESWLGKGRFIGVRLQFGTANQEYEVIIGRTDGHVSPRLEKAIETRELECELLPEQIAFLRRLLEFSFTTVLHFPDRLHETEQRSRVTQAKDVVSLLLAAVPMPAPDSWKYVAFRSQQPNKTLKTVTCTAEYKLHVARSEEESDTFYADLEEWVIANGEALVVDSYATDHALFADSSQVRAFVLAPAFAGSEVRGVLYVGAKEADHGRPVFSQDDLALLQFLASVIAESYQRRRLASISSLIRQIPRQTPQDSADAEINHAVARALREVVAPTCARADQAELLNQQYLLALVTQVVGVGDTTALAWLMPKISKRMREFLAAEHSVVVGLQARPDSRVFALNHDALVTFIPRVRGEKDREEIPQKLLERLTPLNKLMYGADIMVWRLYYSYDRLASGLLDDHGVVAERVDFWSNYVESGVRDLTATIMHIIRANRARADGRFLVAIDELEDAHHKNRQNAYVLRHLNEAYLMQGDFAQAVGYGRLALEADELAGENYAGTHYWYGRALVRAGKTEEGLVELGKAAQLTPSPTHVMEYAAAVVECMGQADPEALFMLIDRAIPQADKMQAAWLYTLKSDLLRSLGQMDEACRVLKTAARKLPADRMLQLRFDQLNRERRKLLE